MLLLLVCSFRAHQIIKPFLGTTTHSASLVCVAYLIAPAHDRWRRRQTLGELDIVRRFVAELGTPNLYVGSWDHMRGEQENIELSAKGVPFGPDYEDPKLWKTVFPTLAARPNTRTGFAKIYAAWEALPVGA